MPIDVDELLLRIESIETEITHSDAANNPYFKGEGLPYWTHYLASLEMGRRINEFGEEANDAMATFICTLAVGNSDNKGVEGAYTRLAFEVARYFNQRPKLQSESFRVGANWVVYSEVTDVRRAAGGSGSGAPLILLVCTLVVHFDEPLEFAYL